MALDLVELQKEIYVWKERNFGGTFMDGHQMLMGVAEEIGELSHSFLKYEQKIRVNEDHIENMKDAIGDIFIFLCNYLTEKGIVVGCSMNEEFHPSGFYCKDDLIRSKILDLYIYLGIITKYHNMVKTIEEHNVDDVKTLISLYSVHVIHTLMEMCWAKGWDFEKIVLNTWKDVKDRDWKKNPKTGNK